MVTRLRNYLFVIKLLPVYKPGNKSIAVGNLSMGGTGKTPVCEYILSLLIENNIRTTYISRGYKRKSKGLYYADNEKNYLNIGDEAFQIHSKFPEIDILLSEKRKTALEEHVKMNGFNGVFVLDDAFQHRYVNCGLNILLTTWDKPYFKDYLFPSGSLRESVRNAVKADVILVNKCPEKLEDKQKDLFIKKLKTSGRKPAFFTSTEYDSPKHAFKNEILNTSLLSEAHIFVFSAIAEPKPMIAYISSYCKVVTSFIYKDHKPFTLKNIQKIIKKYNSDKAASKYLFTTEKDFARIKNLETGKLLKNLPLFILPVKIKFLDNSQTSFNQLILNYVREN